MNEKIMNLIERLIQKTESSQIEWQRTSRENEFSTNMNTGSVSTDSWTTNIGDVVDFKVFNMLGDEIGSWMFDSNEDEYKTILKLHSTVKRKYLKVDETLDGMLDELK